MTKSELINDMTNFTGSRFITVTDLGRYLGVDRSVARKYARGCDKIGYKISVRDIAENLMEEFKD